MTDAERVLAMLIHDVRTPLGVAHGYLRLVRGDKLPAPADRDRALAGTQEALAKISRICQDASAFLEDPPSSAEGRVAAAQLVSRVAAVASERGLPVAEAPAAPGTVAVGTSLDRAAEAIVTLLGLRASRIPEGRIEIRTAPVGLTFSVGPHAPMPVEGGPINDVRPFDPWAASQGLGVVVAHRLVTALGGRVWTGHGLALALTMPVESGNA